MDSELRVWAVYWRPLPDREWGPEWRPDICNDCGNPLAVRECDVPVTADLERKLGCGLPHLCVGCAIARARALGLGVHYALVGPGRAVREVLRVLGVKE